MASPREGEGDQTQSCWLNGPMTQPQRMRGAIDLSSLGASPASAGGSYVVEVDERSFDQTMQGSLRHPIVIEFYSPRAPEQERLSADLRVLADAAAGRWLLARINVDTSRQVAAALQIQAVPTVVGVVGGQLVPLWQGTLSKEEASAYIAELLRLAAQQGVVGKAEPVAGAAAASEPTLDPRLAAAYQAMESEDYAGAEKGFAALLEDNPNDAAARAGQAQAGLLRRVSTADPASLAARLADPDDLDAVLLAADLDAAQGSPEKAFERLLEVIRRGPGEPRETARARLLDLFETFGPTDPAVLKARRDLATALF